MSLHVFASNFANKSHCPLFTFAIFSFLEFFTYFAEYKQTIWWCKCWPWSWLRRWLIGTIWRIVAKWDIPKLFWGLHRMAMISWNWKEYTHSGGQSYWRGRQIDDSGFQKKIDDANVGHENHEYLYNTESWQNETFQSFFEYFEFFTYILCRVQTRIWWCKCWPWSWLRRWLIWTIHRILAKWDIPKLLWGLQKETMTRFLFLWPMPNCQWLCRHW